MDKLGLTVIIICSTDKKLAKCLASIDDAETKVLVVLNFPSQEVRSIVEHFNVDHIEMNSRRLGELREVSIAKVTTEYVMFLDSDCVLQKGSLNAIKEQFGMHLIIKPVLTYDFDNWGSRIVSRLRSFTTYKQDLPLLPIVLNCSIKNKIGGYYFNRGLVWGEDRDFALRVLAANLHVEYVRNATVIHSKLTILDDLKSAYRIGVGRYYQSELGIFKHRKLTKDLLLHGEMKQALAVAKSNGFVVGAYHLLGWRTAYKLGYYTKRLLTNFFE